MTSKIIHNSGLGTGNSYIQIKIKLAGSVNYLSD